MSASEAANETTDQTGYDLSREISNDKLQLAGNGEGWLQMGENACEEIESSGDLSSDDHVLKLVRIVIRSQCLNLIKRVIAHVHRYLSQQGREALAEIVAREKDAHLIFVMFRHAGDDFDSSLWTLIDVLKEQSAEDRARSILRYASVGRLSEEQKNELQDVVNMPSGAI